jgi:hypothetical protein
MKNVPCWYLRAPAGHAFACGCLNVVRQATKTASPTTLRSTHLLANVRQALTAPALASASDGSFAHPSASNCTGRGGPSPVIEREGGLLLFEPKERRMSMPGLVIRSMSHDQVDPAEQADPVPRNVRRHGDPAADSELKASIAAHGLLQNLIVRPAAQGQVRGRSRRAPPVRLAGARRRESPAKGITRLPASCLRTMRKSQSKRAWPKTSTASR